MNAEITMSQLWWNPEVLHFFFRTQAENTLRDFLDRVEDTQSALYAIEEYAEECSLSLDDIEEEFYNDTIAELADLFGVELTEQEEE